MSKATFIKDRQLLPQQSGEGASREEDQKTVRIVCKTQFLTGGGEKTRTAASRGQEQNS